MCALAYEANPMPAIIADSTGEQTGFAGDKREACEGRGSWRAERRCSSRAWSLVGTQAVRPDGSPLRDSVPGQSSGRL
jgi:hypothetical protein